MSKRRIRGVMALWISVAALSTSAAQRWETDFLKCAESAKAFNRYLLLDFSGSDWCGWCMKLDEEVFSQREFKKYAESNLVCVLLDFPRGRSLPSKLQEQNTELAKKYGVRGYPSVIILSPSGELVATTGYHAGGSAAYVTRLQALIDPHRTNNKVPPPTAIASGAARSLAVRPLQRPTSADLPKDESREMRTWKTRSGTTLTASLVEEKGLYLILKKEGGVMVRLEKSRLVAEDQQYLAKLKQDRAAEAAAPAGTPPRSL